MFNKTMRKKTIAGISAAVLGLGSYLMINDNLIANSSSYDQINPAPLENIITENYNSNILEEQTLLQEKIDQLSLDARNIEDNSYISRLPDSNPQGLIHHSVQNGDSLYSIASNYLETNSPREIYPFIDEILSTNSLRSDVIRTGDILTIPIQSNKPSDILEYNSLNLNQKIDFFRDRTIANAEPYIRDAVITAEEYGIDARIVMAIGGVESNFNPNARSSMGAVGIWQQMPGFHNVSDDDIENLKTKIDYVKDMYDRFLSVLGDEDSALISSIAGYNAGRTRVMEHIRSGRWDGRTIESIPRNGNNNIGFSTETRNYVRRVVNKLQEYGVNLD